MTPYYQDDAVTIYHGDCRDVLPELPRSRSAGGHPAQFLKADVLITDPPYGVALGSGDQRVRGHLHKQGYETFDDAPEAFHETVARVVQALAVTRRAAVFMVAHRLWEFPAADALGGVFVPAGVGRNKWGFTGFWPVLLYGKNPALHEGCHPTVISSHAIADVNGHPVSKPLRWMTWLIGLASLPDELVLDPFCGSGTTLRAAKDAGRKAIGIEIEERYCEIAAKRCAQEVLSFGAVLGPEGGAG